RMLSIGRTDGVSWPIESIRRDASLDHVVARVVASPNALPVVDDDGCYCGSVDRALILKAITRSRGSHV
ncbi:glycine betaine/L-proline ABC transporter ATP-binding protein, partial [Burkholderia cenocepacia]|uniref:CBS domain-containing protein n=1 Tax=Burkholderia cenocepacia TaxID=95486 RepID=UPI003211AF33|nr:glycine betaine/L-proline ABC transporter ATP-binding protein [Burkholderia cenocepacia]